MYTHKIVLNVCWFCLYSRVFGTQYLEYFLRASACSLRDFRQLKARPSAF